MTPVSDPTRSCPVDWAVVAAFGLVLFIAEELRKLIARQLARHRVSVA